MNERTKCKFNRQFVNVKMKEEKKNIVRRERLHQCYKKENTKTKPTNINEIEREKCKSFYFEISRHRI